MTPATIPVPWIGITIAPSDRILRVVIAEGTHRGQPYAGAYIAVRCEDGRVRVAHRFQGAENVALDDFPDLLAIEGLRLSAGLERSMARAPIQRLYCDAARALAALGALAAAEAGGDDA